MSQFIAIVLALIAAVHVGAPAIGAPAPLPVLLVFTYALGTLTYLIVRVMQRDGLIPVWRTGVPS